MLVSVRAGTIQTVAGTGEPDYSGDGGLATAACLNEPKNCAVDRVGNLYIADSENHLIRKVDLAAGIIYTIAGCHEPASPSGSGIPSTRAESKPDDDPLGSPEAAVPDHFVQLADVSGTVRFVVGGSSQDKRYRGDGGPAGQALLHFPTAVAVDEQGDLFIADTMNHRVRRVDAGTGTITTVAGTGQPRYSGDGSLAVAAGLNEPTALVVDRQGHLYIADQSNNRIRVVDLKTGVIRTVAGTGTAAYAGDSGPACEAALAGPSGLALGPRGELYIADTFNGRIRVLDLKSGVISTAVGDGGEYRYQGQADVDSKSLSRPYGIAVDREGHIFITDSDSHLLRKWDCQRQVLIRVTGAGTAAYGGDGGPADQAGLSYPFGVAVDRQGHIFIADTFNHRIRMITA